MSKWKKKISGENVIVVKKEKSGHKLTKWVKRLCGSQSMDGCVKTIITGFLCFGVRFVLFCFVLHMRRANQVPSEQSRGRLFNERGAVEEILLEIGVAVEGDDSRSTTVAIRDQQPLALAASTVKFKPASTMETSRNQRVEQR